jgi:preprotein translocase subunit SecG
MYTLLMTISVILSILLIIIILLQSSKGEGLAGTFGGGGASNFGTVFGTRRTADFLSKATWWLGGGILFLSIMVNLFFLPGQTTSEQRRSVIQSSRQQTAVPTTPALPAPIQQDTSK